MTSSIKTFTLKYSYACLMVHFGKKTKAIYATLRLHKRMVRIYFNPLIPNITIKG